MTQQTNNSPNNLPGGKENEDNQNETTIVNSQSQNKIVNKDDESIINEEDGNAESVFPTTSDDQSKKEKSFYKNDMPSGEEEKIEDGSVNAAVKSDKRDESEDVDEQSPKIGDAT